MNPLILTKAAKFTLIGSLSAFVSFAASFHPDMQILLGVGLAGSTFITVAAVLWEGRGAIGSMPSEEGLSNLLSTMQPKPKKQYLLSPQLRLEIVIGLIVVLIASLIGAL
jgi:hypothetical protein